MENIERDQARRALEGHAGITVEEDEGFFRIHVFKGLPVVLGEKIMPRGDDDEPITIPC